MRHGRKASGTIKGCPHTCEEQTRAAREDLGTENGRQRYLLKQRRGNVSRPAVYGGVLPGVELWRRGEYTDTQVVRRDGEIWLTTGGRRIIAIRRDAV